ncbi:MAG: calcium-translocating P-type ATPase, SERCA-type [Candidatus Aenigmarchaeota archaeon]|nr:calcium-translocating P-type ATPase, SERCA-type [Candidatus Aenigmarchaeota archaeon]
MEWHTLPAAEMLRELNATAEGLASRDAARRLEHYGPNQLQEKKGTSPLALFLAQFRNALVLILLAATIFSFLIGEAVDGAVILIIVILNAVFGFVQEYRADKALEALKRLTSPESLVLRDGRKTKIPSRELVPGDVVFLEEGTKIPADLRILSSANLKVDEASLTGESKAVTKAAGVTQAKALGDRVNMAFAGTHAVYGHGTGIVVETGMGTEIGKIAHLIQEAPDLQTPLQKRLAVFGKHLGILILAISAIVTVGGILRSYEVFDMILTGIAIAVAAIPEGLPAVVTITLALGLQRLSKEHALIRRLPAVETLGSTSVICSDKTGTITKNEMTVRKAWIQGMALEVTGTGYQPDGQFLFKGKPSQARDLPLLLRCAALCNNASLEGGRMLGDPTEGALLVAAAKVGPLPREFPRVGEIPFSSERKMMSTINLVHGQKTLFTKGAPELVLARCSHVLRDGKPVRLDRKTRDAILAANHGLAGEALRVLGFALRAGGEKEEGLTFIGLLGMIDPPRDTVAQDIALCRKAGIQVVMITGDHRETAVAVAKEIGLYREGDRALTGEELDALSDAQLRAAVRETRVFARVNPIHKVRIVEALQRHGEVAAMTGDGVNDAPALKRADIGVAMGITGTDVAKEASQMVLTDDNFSSIVHAIREGRGIYDNISRFILYLLSSNIAEVLILFLALLLFPAGAEPLLPLVAVQLLWVNLITDGLPALALGVDPTVKGIMDRPPRPAKEALLNRRAFSYILVAGAVITAGTLWLFAWELQEGLVKAQTMAFTMLVVYELVNVFVLRRLGGLSFLCNRKLLLAVAVSFALQLLVIYIPALNEAFNTAPLSPADWVDIAVIALSLPIAMGIWGRLSRPRREMQPAPQPAPAMAPGRSRARPYRRARAGKKDTSR